MIRIDQVSKTFGDIDAVSNLTLSIEKGQVFGLIGTNGAGKSTLLRMVSGILRPDHGSITIDELPVYDNPEAKKLFFFIPDEPWFFPNSDAREMESYYRMIHPSFDTGRFFAFMKDFGLDPSRRISRYSKGMKKQLAILFGICSGTDYLLLDETFDGLDPVMRQAAKSLFAGEMEERGLTPLITSHNLRELEDICDHVGLLHEGGLLLSEELTDMKLGMLKLQCVFSEGADERKALSGLTILNEETRGRLRTFVIRGEREEVLEHFKGIDTVFFEILPLTLEEIFIAETEVAGYDIKKLILGQ